MSAKTKFVVCTASAPQPSSRKWKHPRRRVAVLEIERGTVPSMISTRARGVVRVVETWEDLFVGKTDGCQYSRAMREAEALVAELNA